MREGKYSIGEICSLCNVSSSKLRYYDEMGLIKPAFVDRHTGYRYYDHDTTVLISIIKYYQACGFSLKDIKKMLDVDDMSILGSMFEDRIRELEAEIVSLTIQRDSIGAWHGLLKEQRRVVETGDDTVSRKTFHEALMYVNEPYMLEDMQYESLVADIELFNHIPGAGYYTVGPFYLYFADGDWQNFKDARVFINPHPLENSSVAKEMAGGFDALCTYAAGSSSNCRAAYERIREYAAENGIELRGDSFQRSVVDRWSTSNEECYLVEIIMPVVGDLEDTTEVTFGI